MHERAAFRRGAGRASYGFTLLEITLVIFIIGLMLTLVVPYVGGLGVAQLRSEARRLAGRVSYLHERAAAEKVVLRVVFDLDRNGYRVTRLDPYALRPVFGPAGGPASKPVRMPSAVAIRDVTIAGLGTFTRGSVACQFYPEGYVDPTLVHLVDTSGDVITLFFNPLTGRVSIAAGDLDLEALAAR